MVQLTVQDLLFVFVLIIFAPTSLATFPLLFDRVVGLVFFAILGAQRVAAGEPGAVEAGAQLLPLLHISLIGHPRRIAFKAFGIVEYLDDCVA